MFIHILIYFIYRCPLTTHYHLNNNQVVELCDNKNSNHVKVELLGIRLDCT